MEPPQRISRYELHFSPNLWIPFNFGDPNERYSQFLSKGRPEIKNFIENLLLYDQVVLPTNDFMALSILLGVFDESFVAGLLERHKIRFIRLKGALGFLGGGHGLDSMAFRDPGHRKDMAVSGQLDNAINWAISGLNKPISRSIIEQVIDCSMEVEVSDYIHRVKELTYRTIAEITSIRKYFPHLPKNLDNIGKLDANQVRIYGGFDANTKTEDPVEILMRLAHANLEILLFGDSSAKDITTVNPIFEALRNPLLSRYSNHSENFCVLRKIENLPDIGEWLLRNPDKRKTLLHLIDSSSTKDFRRWYESTSYMSTGDFTKEYLTMVRSVEPLDRLPSKILRFLVPTAMGFGFGPVGSIAAALVSFADLFMPRRIIQSSPKYFVDDLKTLNGRIL